MTVHELIEELSKVTNQNLPVHFAKIDESLEDFTDCIEVKPQQNECLLIRHCLKISSK